MKSGLWIAGNIGQYGEHEANGGKMKTSVEKQILLTAEMQNVT